MSTHLVHPVPVGRVPDARDEALDEVLAQRSAWRGVAWRQLTRATSRWPRLPGRRGHRRV